MKEIIIKKCKVCSQEFSANTKQHIYCSIKCNSSAQNRKKDHRTDKERKRSLDKYKRLNQGKNYRFTYIKYRASKRDIQFLLKKDFFNKIYGEPCFYCTREFDVMSLDRVDSKFGYTEDNVVSCCIQCNQSKGGRKQEDFIKMCNLVSIKHSNLKEKS